MGGLYGQAVEIGLFQVPTEFPKWIGSCQRQRLSFCGNTLTAAPREQLRCQRTAHCFEIALDSKWDVLFQQVIELLHDPLTAQQESARLAAGIAHGVA